MVPEKGNLYGYNICDWNSGHPVFYRVSWVRAIKRPPEIRRIDPWCPDRSYRGCRIHPDSCFCIPVLAIRVDGCSKPLACGRHDALYILPDNEIDQNPHVLLVVSWSMDDKCLAGLDNAVDHGVASSCYRGLG